MALGLGCASFAAAQSGSWINTVDGTWSTAANWSGGTIADGAAGIATFDQDVIDLGATPLNRAGVQLDTPRTINGLVFGDTNTSTPGGWEVYTNDAALNILTLAGTTPTITVNQLGNITTGGALPIPAVFDDAIIRPTIAGTAGLTKTGTGVLTIAGAVAHTFTGGVNLNQGTLRFAGAGNGIVAGQAFNIANGTTLAARSSLDGAGARVFTVASGSTINLDIENSVGLGRFDAGGATINVNFPSATNANAGASTRFTPEGNWLVTATAFPTAVNIASQLAAPTPGVAPTGAVFRIAPNLSGTAGRNFNANSFANTVVNVDNTLVYGRTNSGGNTTNFGSLSGTATATLSGGNAGAHMIYSIGALNTDTEFAGTIDHLSGQMAEGTFSNAQGGINITKVGTGKLTLSGTLNYQPTLNTGGGSATNRNPRGWHHHRVDGHARAQESRCDSGRDF